MFINNPNTTALPSGYSLKLAVDTAALVSAGKLLANGDDLRVVWTGGGAPLDLDRVADTAFNASATEIWFKSQASIPASGQDNSYYIYYGNPAAGAPPENPTNVFALYDGFDDTTVNTTLWTQAGSVSESGGWARLSAGGNLYGKQTFTYGMLEMRIQTISEGGYMWWGWEDGASDAPNFMVFEDYPSPTNLAALLRNDGAPYQTLTLTTQPAGGLTVPHTYATEWRPGQARWYVDSAQVQSATTGLPDTPMSANFNANQVAYNIDWARARLLATHEPVVALASSYHGYVSQGTFTSSARDTGGTSAWKYLVWDATTPPQTGIALRVRTAATQGGLDAAPWMNYDRSGLLISNASSRWIQYGAALTTTNALTTPVLNRVTIYYEPSSGQPVPLPSTFYGEIHIGDPAPQVGDLVQVQIGGVSRAITTAITSQAGVTLTYQIDVPGDVSGTPEKEGGAEGEVITFTIGSRVVATGMWHSGTNTRLDFHSTSIPLQTGWNLVSFNLRPVSTAITDVLSSLAGHYDLAYAWNAPGQTWLKYDDIAMSGDNLSHVDETLGFWIHITTTAPTLTVFGSLPTTTGITLSGAGSGWNLVGYPSSATRALPGALTVWAIHVWSMPIMPTTPIRGSCSITTGRRLSMTSRT